LLTQFYSHASTQEGQIVFISSLAAYFGLPETPSYSAASGDLKRMGEGLRGWLAPERAFR